MITGLTGRSRQGPLPAVIVLAVALTCGCSGSRDGGTATSIRPPVPGASSTVVTVPDLVGQAYSGTAEVVAANANLLSNYHLEHSSTVVADSVISETPPAGSRVPTETTVIFVVSIGPTNIPGAQSCQAAHLKVQPGPPVSEATGQHTHDWSFTNLAAPCVIEGYPAILALNKERRVLGFSYSHAGDQMTTGAPPQPVYLPKGGAAWIRINKYRCDVAVQDMTMTLQVSLPSGGGSLDIPASLEYCAEAPNSTIAVSPFEPVEMLLHPSR